VLTDASNDADEQPYLGRLLPTPSVAAADLLAVAAWRDDRQLHVRMTTSGAPTPDSQSPTGYSYDLRVHVGDVELSMGATTRVDGTAFSLTRVTPPNSPPDNTDAAPVTGRFDVGGRAVYVDVPFTRMRSLVGTSVSKATLTGIAAWTYRIVGTDATGSTFLPTDSASSDRSYVIPTGHCR
jgi:hypothetical protein